MTWSLVGKVGTSSSAYGTAVVTSSAIDTTGADLLIAVVEMRNRGTYRLSVAVALMRANWCAVDSALTSTLSLYVTLFGFHDTAAKPLCHWPRAVSECMQ